MGRRADAPARVILVDKPAGPTSHDMVHVLRGALSMSRIGHTGTLDPFATGLLVMLIGRATRLAPYLSGLDKTYLATVRMGARSESGDPEGPITAGGPLPDEATVRVAVEAIGGVQQQMVPALSAVRVDGERLYTRTRRGETVIRPTREVTVHHARLLAYDPVTGLASVDIRCGSGTYVRQLAVDLGEAIGCGAYCVGLRRTRVGELSVVEAIAPHQVTADSGADPIEALGFMPRVELDAAAADDVGHGRTVQVDEVIAEGHVALVRAGCLIAVGEGSGTVAVQPRVVMTG